MSEYPWNKKNNTFTWLSSLYNPFKEYLSMTNSYGFFSAYHVALAGDLPYQQLFMCI